MSIPDLSGYWMVPISDVAKVFGMSEAAIRQRIYHGNFPVQPKTKKPFKWSSAELRAWFENDKKRAL